VLLADDPLAGLDPETARHVTAMLDALDARRTLVVSQPERSTWLSGATELRLEPHAGAEP
jgi:energy-coupling factor transporter ATP-binding protein EcfA2